MCSLSTRRIPAPRGTRRGVRRAERFDDAIAAGEELIALLAVMRRRASAGRLGVLARWGVSGGRPGSDRRGSLDGCGRTARAPGRVARARSRASRLLGQHQMVSSQSADAIVTMRACAGHGRTPRAPRISPFTRRTVVARAMASLADDAGLDVMAEALDRAKRAGIYHEVTRAPPRTLPRRCSCGTVTTDVIALLDYGIAVRAERELRFNRNGLPRTRGRARCSCSDAGTTPSSDIRTRARRARPVRPNRIKPPAPSSRHRSERAVVTRTVRRARRGLRPRGTPFEEMQLLVPVVVARAEAPGAPG